MDWRDDLFVTISKHIQRDAKDPYAYRGLMSWWMNNHTSIIGEIEHIVSDEAENESLNELNSLATIIGADARIDNNDQNVQRIIYLINTFIEEIEQEVDYGEDEE